MNNISVRGDLDDVYEVKNERVWQLLVSIFEWTAVKMCREPDVSRTKHNSVFILVCLLDVTSVMLLTDWCVIENGWYFYCELRNVAKWPRRIWHNFPYSAVKITHEECMTRENAEKVSEIVAESPHATCHIIHVAGQITDDWTFCRQKRPEHWQSSSDRNRMNSNETTLHKVEFTRCLTTRLAAANRSRVSIRVKNWLWPAVPRSTHNNFFSSDHQSALF